MDKRSSKLTSGPFLSLYLAAIGAIFLELGRHRWGSAGWFPIAVGVVAALAIIPVRLLLRRHLVDRSRSDWGRIIFFLICGILPVVGLRFLGREDMILICGLLVMSAVFLWAAFGTLFEWPGFRPPPKPNECRKCRYDLTNNVSGVCPECGTPISLKGQSGTHSR
jgi:hypothetical protein